VKERPILFSGPMVRAILEGRKTQTRRVVNLARIRPSVWTADTIGAISFFVEHGWRAQTLSFNCNSESFVCPYGDPGDRLWVRETLARTVDDHGKACVAYRADGRARQAFYEDGGEGDFSHVGPETPWTALDAIWTPSIFMRRKESRITLEITDVRVRRVQEIGEGDLLAEGTTIPCTEDGRPLMALTSPSPTEYVAKPWTMKGPNGWTQEDWLRGYFGCLWDSINAKRGLATVGDPRRGVGLAMCPHGRRSARVARGWEPRAAYPRANA